jgi:hypothetical protein
MKPLKLSLRIWIALTSIVSFLGGWAMFSHAGKPAPLFSASHTPVPASTGSAPATLPLPTLQPIPSLDSLISNNPVQSQIQPLPAAPQFNIQQSYVPRMRTMGS